MRHRRTHFVHAGRRAALLATAALPLLVAAPAFAQDSQPETAAPADAQAAAPDDQAIVVTGLRETIQTSIRTKRDQTAIVDALSDYGVADIEMPATPERVWQAIRSAKAQHTM